MREFFAGKLLPETDYLKVTVQELAALAATDSEFYKRWQELLALRHGNAQKAKEFIQNSLNFNARTKPRREALAPWSQAHRCLTLRLARLKGRRWWTVEAFCRLR
jgi:hypothetical protein